MKLITKMQTVKIPRAPSVNVQSTVKEYNHKSLNIQLKISLISNNFKALGSNTQWNVTLSMIFQDVPEISGYSVSRILLTHHVV